MLAPEERERLLRALVGVYIETEPARTEHPPRGSEHGRGSAAPPVPFPGLLRPAEEAAVTAIREALETIAAAVSGEPTPAGATATALGGAELTLRWEIIAGHPERLPELLPGFAYLVTLPHLGEPEAARRSAQVEEAIRTHRLRPP